MRRRCFKPLLSPLCLTLGSRPPRQNIGVALIPIPQLTQRPRRAGLFGAARSRGAIRGRTAEGGAERRAAIVTSNATIYLPLAQMIDLAAERERLGKEQKDVSAQIERITKLLGSDFANKAPANVVQKERDKLADFQARAEKLREQIGRLS